MEAPSVDTKFSGSPENKRSAFPVSKNTLYLVFDAVVRSEAQAKVIEDVSQRLTRAYGRSSKHNNLRRCADEFMLNQEVWRRNYVISVASEGMTSKLSPKFEGTLKIIRICSSWSCELADIQGKSCGIWHAEDLESHPSEEENDLEEYIAFRL
ncbi:hypothetical protein JTB14_016988 [Gonioctena quinquepunctata]|nr:hypothetical protein JTB14_016988 [Gonioctena quinquepunctata]